MDRTLQEEEEEETERKPSGLNTVTVSSVIVDHRSWNIGMLHPHPQIHTHTHTVNAACVKLLGFHCVAWIGSGLFE